MAIPSTHLGRGDLLPRIVVAPPGPASRALAARLTRVEAPGVNTVAAGAVAIAWRAARGANVLDVDGNRYLDFTAGFGVAAVGHRHPRIVAAVRRQSAELLHGLGDAAPHPARADLAERLAARAPVADGRVYFAISGADAVEIALKTSLLATGRPGIIAFEPAYHGATLGALAVTSRVAFRRPFAAHLHAAITRLPFGAELAAVERHLAGGEPGCVIVEPVVGREGVLVPPPGWLAGLAAACRKHGALLAADEIFTGFGRTGAWFACAAAGVRPDLLCCGKALGGGMPIAAVIGRRPVMAAWATPGEALHTATFLAHPPACAAALATLDVLEDLRLPERAALLGAGLERRLGSWTGSAAVSAVRGLGLLWGIELASAGAARAFCTAAARRGVLVLAGGPDGRVAQLAPPLVITERQLAAGLEILEAALDEVGTGR